MLVYKKFEKKSKCRLDDFISQDLDRKQKAYLASFKEVWEGLREPVRDVEIPKSSNSGKALLQLRLK